MHQCVSQSQIWSLPTSFHRKYCIFDCRHVSVCWTIAPFSLETFFTVATDALLADGSKFEANHGENVTIPFTMDKAEKADRLRITFTSETTKKSVIAQQCDPSDGCAVVNTPGVSLIVAKGRVCVTIQRVNSSRSGIYEARAFFGKDVCEVNATLVVNEASFSSTIAPPHSSTPKPLNSDLLWLCALIPLVIVILGGVCFWKHRKSQLMLKKPEKALLSPDPVSPKERTGNTTAVNV